MTCPIGDVAAVRIADGRPDVLRALFLPHTDTPYGNGAFYFDILLPADYPMKPPQVRTFRP
eukprot:4694039-Pyramimonas_sp.AAC.2